MPIALLRLDGGKTEVFSGLVSLMITRVGGHLTLSFQATTIDADCRSSSGSYLPNPKLEIMN